MSIITSQQIGRLYEQYKTSEVTFNKQVIAATGLVGRNVFLKIQDRQLPCMVFSASMASAKVVASISSAVFTTLKQINNRLALRFCFKLPDKAEPITFFVTCHASGFIHYAVQDPDVHIVTLEFTQRPPDDLITILGSLQEASSNAQRRKDERIQVTPESLKKLGLDSREAVLVVDGVGHRCVLRDLSFSGAKVLAPGAAESFVGRKASLRMVRADQAGDVIIAADVRRVEEAGGRKDIMAIGMEFIEPPMSYKLLINSYLSTVRKVPAEPAKAAPAAGDGRQASEPDPAATTGKDGNETRNG